MSTLLRFDRFEVDMAAGRLFSRGTRIHLREQSFQVLALLLERPGEVVSRDDLRRRLWPAELFLDFENSLNTAVARLREALGDSAHRPRFVETLPKRGYRFISAVSAPGASPSPVPKPRLLVLPFVNSTGDPSQEFFSDGMTDEIITELAAAAPEDLAVIARTTAMRYKGSRKAIASIGAELNVEYIVEGAVHRAGDCVGLTVQLIRTSDQAHLWAKRYDAPLGDLLRTQRDIGQTITDHLGIAASRAVASARRRRPTEDLDAYALYQEGRHHFFSRWTTAKRCFVEAIERDPQFALAYDALAELCWYQGFMGLAPPKDVSAAGMFYAARALEIDNTVAETHALLAMFKKEIDFDKGEMKRTLERARELNALSPLVRLRYAVAWLMPTCRLKEAIVEIEDALDSDPLSILTRAWLGTMCWLDRQYDRAIAQGRQMVEIEPTNFMGFWHLGIYTREKALFDESLAANRRALELSGESRVVLGWYGLALGQSGNVAEARAVLDRLHEDARRTYVPPSSLALTYLGLGDVDHAFLWMDRAVDACDHMLTPIRSYPFLDPFRTDPRYVALLEKLKMTPPVRSCTVATT